MNTSRSNKELNVIKERQVRNQNENSIIKNKKDDVKTPKHEIIKENEEGKAKIQRPKTQSLHSRNLIKNNNAQDAIEGTISNKKI